MPSEPAIPPAMHARHPGTQNLYRWLMPSPARATTLSMEVAEQFHALADWLVAHLVDHPELNVALRHLLDAREAAVRAAQHTTWQQAWTQQPSEDIS